MPIHKPVHTKIARKPDRTMIVAGDTFEQGDIRVIVLRNTWPGDEKLGNGTLSWAMY